MHDIEVVTSGDSQLTFLPSRPRANVYGKSLPIVMDTTPARNSTHPYPKIFTPLPPLDRVISQTAPIYQESPGRKLVVDALFKGDHNAGTLALGDYLSMVGHAVYFQERSNLL